MGGSLAYSLRKTLENSKEHTELSHPEGKETGHLNANFCVISCSWRYHFLALLAWYTCGQNRGVLRQINADTCNWKLSGERFVEVLKVFLIKSLHDVARWPREGMLNYTEHSVTSLGQNSVLFWYTLNLNSVPLRLHLVFEYLLLCGWLISRVTIYSG